MTATLTYEAITARAEQQLRASLELAAQHRAEADPTSACLARGAALGVMSMWEGLVADLGGLLEDVFQTDRARLFALIRSDAASSTPG